MGLEVQVGARLGVGMGVGVGSRSRWDTIQDSWDTVGLGLIESRGVLSYLTPGHRRARVAVGNKIRRSGMAWR